MMCEKGCGEKYHSIWPCQAKCAHCGTLVQYEHSGGVDVSYTCSKCEELSCRNCGLGYTKWYHLFLIAGCGHVVFISGSENIACRLLAVLLVTVLWPITIVFLCMVFVLLGLEPCVAYTGLKQARTARQVRQGRHNNALFASDRTYNNDVLSVIDKISAIENKCLRYLVLVPFVIVALIGQLLLLVLMLVLIVLGLPVSMVFFCLPSIFIFYFFLIWKSPKLFCFTCIPQKEENPGQPIKSQVNESEILEIEMKQSNKSDSQIKVEDKKREPKGGVRIDIF